MHMQHGSLCRHILLLGHALFKVFQGRHGLARYRPQRSLQFRGALILHYQPFIMEQSASAAKLSEG